jgi:fibronectin type 3 domain-containing protein
MGAPRHVVVALMMLLVVAGSCGKDSAITPLDTVAPNPPVGVVTMLDDSRSIRISWDPNSELDLAGYRIYCSLHETGPFGQVSTRLVLCPWYYAQTTPMDVTYFKVTAVDRSGNESAYSQAVTVFMSGGKPGEPSTPAQN